MVWSVLQSNSANSTSGSTPHVAFTTANLSSGTVLLCAVSCYNAKTNSVTDASSNSFTKIGAVLLGGAEANGETSLWAIATPSGDVGTKPTITAHLDHASAGVAIVIQEVSGIQATADGTAGTATAASGTNINPSYSSAASNEYLVSAAGDNGGPETMTQLGSGYSADPKNLNNNGIANGLIDYKNSTGGAESGGWSSGSVGGCYTGGVLVAFQLAGGSSFSGSPSTGITLSPSTAGAKQETVSRSTGITLSPSAAGAKRATAAASTGLSLGSSVAGAKREAAARTTGLNLSSTIIGSKSGAAARSTGLSLTASAAGTSQRASSPSTGLAFGGSTAGTSQRASSPDTGLAFGSSVAGSVGGGSPAGSPSTGFAFAASAAGAKSAAGAAGTGIAFTPRAVTPATGLTGTHAIVVALTNAGAL